MSYSWNVNVTPATAAVAIFNLKALLKNRGWTVTFSGDGVATYSAGDVISSGGSGANGMDNAKAWFVVQNPASPNRQFCFQRQTTTGANTSYQWRVKYSKSAGFTGGSPAFNVTPSATDEQILLGGGTDASPTFAALFSVSTDGGFRHQLVADDASPYSWASFAWANTTGIPCHGLFFDPITSSTLADVDTVVIYINGVVSASANGGVAGAGAGQYESFIRNNAKLYGYSAGSWASTITAMAWMVSNAGTYKLVFPAGTTADEDGKDEGAQVAYCNFNFTSNLGTWKGFSTLLYWASVIRATGSTLSVSGTKDRVVFCDVSLPWNGTDPTI